VLFVAIAWRRLVLVIDRGLGVRGELPVSAFTTGASSRAIAGGGGAAGCGPTAGLALAAPLAFSPLVTVERRNSLKRCSRELTGRVGSRP